MNKNQVSSQGRFYIASIFVAFSAILYFAAYLMYMEPKIEPDYDTKRDRDMSACMKFGESKGLEVKREGKKVISMTSEDFEDPKYLFTKLESVIIACDNIELKSFCMGLDSYCTINGTKMAFSYEEPVTY